MKNCFSKYYFCLCLLCLGGNCFTRYNPPPLIYLLLLLLLLPDLDAATHRHHLPAPIQPFQSGFFSLFRAFDSKDFLQGGFEEELAKLEGSAMSPDGISWWVGRSLQQGLLASPTPSCLRLDRPAVATSNLAQPLVYFCPPWTQFVTDSITLSNGYF